MMVFARRRIRSSAACLLGAGLLLALSACGGGGGNSDKSPNNDGAQPQAAEGFLTPVDTRLTPSHFRMIGLPSSGTDAQERVAIIDTDSQQIVKILSGYHDLSGADERVAIDTAAGTAQYLGGGYAYMIKGGKVMQLDLSGATVSEPKQISAISNACSVSRGFSPMAPDGKHQWVSVYVRKEGNTCADPGSYVHYYVMSDAPVTQPGILASSSNYGGGLEIEGALYDKLGISQGLLVMDRDAHRLYVASNDLQRELYGVKDNIVATAQEQQYMWPLRDSQKGVLVLGRRLYVADWRSGKLVLNDSGFTLSQGWLWDVSVFPSKEGTYLVDKAAVYRMPAGAAQFTKLLDLPALPAGATSNWVWASDAPDSVVVQQSFYLASSGSQSNLLVIDKATGQSRSVDLQQAGASTWIMGTSENQVLISRSASSKNAFLSYDLRTNVLTNLYETTDFMQPWPQYSGAGKMTDVLLFLSQGMGSVETTIKSYNVASGQWAEIGKLPPDTPIPGGAYSSSNDTTWADQPGLLNRAGEIWMFKSRQAGSLVRLPQPN